MTISVFLIGVLEKKKLLLLISDYVDLVSELIRVAKEAGVKDKVITDLLNQRTKYHGMNHEA